MRLTQAMAYLKANPKDFSFVSQSRGRRDGVGEVFVDGYLISHIDLVNNIEAKELRSELKAWKNKLLI